MSDGGDGMGFAPIVTFCIRKGEENLPDFLTAVRREGLPLRRFTGRCGEIPARLYPRLARLAKERGVLLRHTGKRGGYYLFARYRRRLGILAGVTMFFSGLLFSQSFLWAIDVEPTAMVSEQQVLDVLKSHGVRIGTFLPAADLTRVAFYARTELPGLAFFALNRVGSRLEVEMADAVQPPVPQEGSGLCNIVASKPGIVRTVEDYAGEQAVRVGESVAEGQLLISGIIENRDGNMLYVHADGKVMAETLETRTFTFPLTRTEREYTGEVKTRWRADLFGRKWPLFLAIPEEEPYESSFTLSAPDLGPFRLPFGVEKEEMRFYRETQVTVTEEEALALLQETAAAYEEELAERMEVLGKEEEAALNDGVMELRVRWTVLEDIAKEQPILDGRE